MPKTFHIFRGARRSGAVLGLPSAEKLGLVRFINKLDVAGGKGSGERQEEGDVYKDVVVKVIALDTRLPEQLEPRLLEQGAGRKKEVGRRNSLKTGFLESIEECSVHDGES